MCWVFLLHSPLTNKCQGRWKLERKNQVLNHFWYGTKKEAMELMGRYLNKVVFAERILLAKQRSNYGLQGLL